jgi:hypothetical protein
MAIEKEKIHKIINPSRDAIRVRDNGKGYSDSISVFPSQPGLNHPSTYIVIFSIEHQHLVLNRMEVGKQPICQSNTDTAEDGR